MRRIRVDLRRSRRRTRRLEAKQRIRGLRRPCLGLGANAENSSRFTENSAAPSDTRNQAANPRPETTLPRPRRQCGEFESIYGEFGGALGHSKPSSESDPKNAPPYSSAPILTIPVYCLTNQRRYRTLEPFFFNDAVTRECFALSLHEAIPI